MTWTTKYLRSEVMLILCSFIALPPRDGLRGHPIPLLVFSSFSFFRYLHPLRANPAACAIACMKSQHESAPSILF